MKKTNRAKAMDQFEKLKIAKSILSRKPGFLQQEFILAGVDEEAASSDMGDKRTRLLPPIIEPWDEDSLSKQGEDFDIKKKKNFSEKKIVLNNFSM